MGTPESEKGSVDCERAERAGRGHIPAGGIITHLREKGNGNIHDTGPVEVTVSSVSCTDYLQNASDLRGMVSEF
jgi:hypothetical protein